MLGRVKIENMDVKFRLPAGSDDSALQVPKEMPRDILVPNRIVAQDLSQHSAMESGFGVVWDSTIRGPLGEDVVCPTSSNMPAVHGKFAEARRSIADKLRPALESFPHPPTDTSGKPKPIRNDIVDGGGRVDFSISIPESPVNGSKRYVQDAEVARAIALHQVAEEAKPGFIHDMVEIAKAGGGEFSAGTEADGYPFAVKSEESAQRKVEDRVKLKDTDTEFPSYVREMGDMLRGTIIVSNYDEMAEAARKLCEIANEKGWAVVIENKFEGETKGGYVGLHFNIGYRVSHGDDELMISTEMQIHTKRNLEVKENLSHAIYEATRVQGADAELKTRGDDATVIIFCAAMTADLQENNG
jgi:hypothetical protein